jgi:acylphosphatase
MRVHLYIKGRVQGVFYRTFTKENANELGLVGWVSNLADGRVEVVAEGKKENLEKFVSILKKGSRLSKVEHMDVVWEKATGEFSSFEIKGY